MVATPAQERFLQAVLSNRYRFLAFGGAIGGGKTYCVLLAIALLCKLFPGSRWAVVRKDLPTLKRTVLPSYTRLRGSLPDFLGAVNRSDWTAKCSNGSEIVFFTESADEDPDLDRWKGLEVNGFALEEANELGEKSFAKAMERAGRWIIPPTQQRSMPHQPPPLILLTFNPASNWVRHTFYDPWKNGALTAPFYFQPSTVADNPHLSDEYLTNLKNLPEAEYRRFVEGDWDAVSGRFFDTLATRPPFLVPRDAVPGVIPGHWAMWGGYDWGFRHNAVCGLFCQDGDGQVTLLESVWMHRLTDPEQAERIATTATEGGYQRALSLVYAGSDAFNRPQAHGYAMPVSVAETFAQFGVLLGRAYTERVGGWRELRRALTPDAFGRTRLQIVDTPNNRRLMEQLLSLEPDRNKPEDVQKVDADDQGRGGDDAADMVRYALASRAFVGAAPVTTPHPALAHQDLTDLGTLINGPEREWDDLPSGF